MNLQKWRRIEKIEQLVRFANQLKAFEFRGGLGCDCEDCRSEEAVCYYDGTQKQPAIHDDSGHGDVALCSACAVRAWIDKVLGG